MYTLVCYKQDSVSTYIQIDRTCRRILWQPSLENCTNPNICTCTWITPIIYKYMWYLNIIWIWYILLYQDWKQSVYKACFKITNNGQIRNKTCIYYILRKANFFYFYLIREYLFSIHRTISGRCSLK
jgi:hypothetical protein